MIGEIGEPGMLQRADSPPHITAKIGVLRGNFQDFGTSDALREDE